MSSDKRRRSRREGVPLTRQRRRQRADRVFYVVCEGEVTEYEYLNMLHNEFGDRGFWFDFPPPHQRRNGLNPRQVVDCALEAAQERDVDAVWALFDRDQHSRVPEVFNDVKREGKVRIAFSNPSFDLWLLLHFRQYPARADGSSEDVHRKLRRLKSYPQFAGFGDRDKRITEDRAAALARNIRTAVKNARVLVDECPTGRCSAQTGHAPTCSPLTRDPSSDVYLLIESLGIVSQS